MCLEFQDCAGNTESALRASHPSVGDVILDLLSWNYHETIMAPSGAAAEKSLQDTIRMHSKDELKWAPSGGLRVSATLVRGMAWGLLHEFAQTGRRLTGRYDRAVYRSGISTHPIEVAPALHP